MNQLNHTSENNNTLIDLFANLMPHKHCFLWADELVPFFFFSNIIIFLSYITISIAMIHVWFKRREIKYSYVIVLFSLFIILCGFGHLITAINMTKGWYIFETYWHILTSIVSLLSAVQIVKLIPALNRVPRIEHLNGIKIISESIFKKEKKLETILDLATSGYWEWDITTGYDWMSESWHKMLGYEVGELEYRVDTWEKLMHPEDLPKAKAAMKLHWSSRGEIPYILMARYKHKKGHWVTMKDVGRVTDWTEDWKPLKMIGYEKLIDKGVSIEQR